MHFWYILVLSLAMYSVATSKTVRSRVIVGVAPSFKSSQRNYQWKEVIPFHSLWMHFVYVLFFFLEVLYNVGAKAPCSQGRKDGVWSTSTEDV